MSKKKTTISDLISQQMNKQMGDIEFQMGVAPYMPEGSKIDPKKAKVHSLPPEYKDVDFNVKAFSVPEGYTGKGYDLPYGRDNIEIPAEPGTVIVIGVSDNQIQIVSNMEDPDILYSMEVAKTELINAYFTTEIH